MKIMFIWNNLGSLVFASNGWKHYVTDLLLVSTAIIWTYVENKTWELVNHRGWRWESSTNWFDQDGIDCPASILSYTLILLCMLWNVMWLTLTLLLYLVCRLFYFYVPWPVKWNFLDLTVWTFVYYPISADSSQDACLVVIHGVDLVNGWY